MAAVAHALFAVATGQVLFHRDAVAHNKALVRGSVGRADGHDDADELMAQRQGHAVMLLRPVVPFQDAQVCASHGGTVDLRQGTGRCGRTQRAEPARDA